MKLLLKNAMIADGSGRPSYQGHVLIKDEKIGDVFQSGQELPEADREIDLSGAVIAPGFIDMHSHSDWALARKDHPEAVKCLVQQGITTVIGGNCGFSPAPLTESSRRVLKQNNTNLLCDRPLDYTWTDMKEFLDHVEQCRPLVNLAQLAGHAAIRTGIAGNSSSPLDRQSLNECLAYAEKALDQGACGISFGLGYPPGMFSPEGEIEAFCRIAAEAGKPAAVHTKALSRISPVYSPLYPRPHNLRAFKEILEIARKTGVRLQISHLVFVGRRTWSTAKRTLEVIENARADGVDVMFDAFAYTFGNSTVDAILPAWYLDKRIKDKDTPTARLLARAELRLGFVLVGFSYSDFQLMDGVLEKWRDLNGLMISDIAKLWGISGFDTILTLSNATGGQAAMLLHTYSGEPGRTKILEKVLSHRLCLFQTDALTRFGGFANAAAIDGFARILGTFARDRGLFSLEDAVHRMTGASAARFGLRDRGEIAPGKAADITVFNPDTINGTRQDKPDQEPAPPAGIRHVFVNGGHVVNNGVFQDGIRAGQVLRQ